MKLNENINKRFSQNKIFCVRKESKHENMEQFLH